MKRNTGETLAYGFGAVGKDMVYAMASGFVLYYYQDICGLPAAFVGLILLIARVFDAVNDPLMGVIVAKTRIRFGRLRPWIFSGSILNAFVLYALFAAPRLELPLLMVYLPVIYVLWSETYSAMDIPYWSMIPAAADDPHEVERLSIVGRVGAGIGHAIVQVGAILAVSFLGGGEEREGFRLVALIIAAVFIIAEVCCALFVKEKKEERSIQTVTIRDMIRSLLGNDQALTIILVIVLVNTALNLTANLLIYFFKYDIGGMSWQASVSLLSAVAGVTQPIAMLFVYPFLRKRYSNTSVFRGALAAAVGGYLVLLAEAFLVHNNIFYALLLPAILIFAANGIMIVLTTVFLSNAVDYGEIKTGHREESVLFSLQTPVVKAASGFAVFLAGVGLDLIGLTGNADMSGVVAEQSAATLAGLRVFMTLTPVIVLTAALLFFRRKYRLTDTAVAENARQLRRQQQGEQP